MEEDAKRRTFVFIEIELLVLPSGGSKDLLGRSTPLLQMKNILIYHLYSSFAYGVILGPGFSCEKINSISPMIWEL